jgi:hypothetical protein
MIVAAVQRRITRVIGIASAGEQSIIIATIAEKKINYFGLTASSFVSLA